MIVHSRWLRETYPINLGDIAPVLKSGMLYVSGRDYKYRPILILNVRRLIESNFETEIIATATAFFCDFVVKKLLIPGRIENWIMIIDLNDVGMTSLPVKKVKSIVGLTQQHFGGRLYRQFCINMSFMMRKSISVFLNFVDDITQQKISAHDDKTYKAVLQNLIPDAQLEYKYGGQKQNIESNFFPPDMRVPGAKLMTYEEMKEQEPDAVRYVAPWGLRKA